MKLGFLGPADGNEKLLRSTAEWLLAQGVDQAIYLGLDDTLEKVVAKWAREIMEGDASEDAFLARASEVAKNGNAGAIEALLASDHAVRRLDALRTLPPPPSRAIEMVDDRIGMVVHDKAILDEEDIANANVIVYGKSTEMVLKRFGPRYFFTPGPLAGQKLGLLELEPSGALVIAVFDPKGKPITRETLQARTSSKMMVTR